VFHLPGKHSQKTHGRGGSGTWKLRDNAEIEEENYQNLKRLIEGMPPGALLRGQPPEEVIREMSKLAEGTKIYDLNGEVELAIPGGTVVSAEDVKRTQSTLADLNSKYPIKSGKVAVVIGKADSFPPTVTGETIPDARVIRVNEVTYQPSFVFENGNTHPESMYRDPAAGNLAHEWGHLVGTGVNQDDMQAAYFLNLNGISGYALQSFTPHEGFAECFADFYMGDDSLPATPNYAGIFGWKERA
jgi:hypothetical protein